MVNGSWRISTIIDSETFERLQMNQKKKKKKAREEKKHP